MRTLVSGCLLACLAGVSLASAQGAPAPQAPAAAPASTPAAAPAASIDERVRKLARIDGFVPIYWDEAAGKLWMEITRFDTELLYQTSLAAGLGSNPVGLDRGALGDTHIVTFQRVGPKGLMIEPNYRYRAISTDADPAT